MVKKDDKEAKEKSLIPQTVSDKFKENYFKAHDITERNRDFIRLCPSFDVALGGGIMSGQIIEIKGVPKGGKSSLSIELAKKAQDQFNKEVHFIDAEMRLRGSLLDIVGINKEHFHVYKSVKGSVLTGPEYLKIITELCEDFENLFIIVDSIPLLLFLNSEAVANAASEITEVLKKIATSVDINNHILVLLNHEKEKIDFRSRVKQYYSPGGAQLQYGSSTIIRVNAGSKIWDGDSEGKKMLGHKMYIDILTSPIAAPCKTELNLLYGKGIDKDGDVVEFAKDAGLIDLKGCWYQYGDIKSQGLSKFMDAIRAENKWDILVSECYKAAGF